MKNLKKNLHQGLETRYVSSHLPLPLLLPPPMVVIMVMVLLSPLLMVVA
jgi:hypothetical protein